MGLCNMAALPNILNSIGPKRNSESPEFCAPSVSSPSDLISIDCIKGHIFSQFPILNQLFKDRVLNFFTLIVKLNTI